jgi:hypothetical protein
MEGRGMHAGADRRDTEGKKELVGFQTGVRESAQSWRELLIDIKQPSSRRARARHSVETLSNIGSPNTC